MSSQKFVEKLVKKYENLTLENAIEARKNRLDYRPKFDTRMNMATDKSDLLAMGGSIEIDKKHIDSKTRPGDDSKTKLSDDIKAILDDIDSESSDDSDTDPNMPPLEEARDTTLDSGEIKIVSPHNTVKIGDLADGKIVKHSLYDEILEKLKLHKKLFLWTDDKSKTNDLLTYLSFSFNPGWTLIYDFSCFKPEILRIQMNYTQCFTYLALVLEREDAEFYAKMYEANVCKF